MVKAAADAELDRERIVERIVAALEVRRRRGLRTGTVPYGMQADRIGALSPCAHELDIIEYIGHGRAAGLTHREIADELNGRGWRTRSGAAWSYKTVWNHAGKRRRRPALSAADVTDADAHADMLAAWRAAGWTDADAAAWLESGVETPADAERWLDIGYEPVNAMAWTDAGFDVASAAPWIEQGVAPDIAAARRDVRV